MSDWRVEIVKIEKIEKHQAADTLSVFTVLGDYPIVDKTGEFSVGDLAIYIAIDSVLPDTEQYHSFTPKAYEKYEEDGEVKQRINGYKYKVGEVPESKRVVKAKKFFGVYSQGLLLKADSTHVEGQDLSEALGITKLIEEEEDNLPIIKARGANQAKIPPGFAVPYFDLQNVRKYIKSIETEEDLVVTEKLHGCFFMAGHDGTNLHVKSRNFFKKKDELDLWWSAAFHADLENKLSKYPMIMLAGELVGNIPKFRYDSEVKDGQLISKLHFFDAYDLKAGKYLDYDDFMVIVNDLGLSSAPLIYRGKWLGKEEMYKMAERKTALGGKHIAEGWVIQPAKGRYDVSLKGRLKLKYISEQYNLQK